MRSRQSICALDLKGKVLVEGYWTLSRSGFTNGFPQCVLSRTLRFEFRSGGRSSEWPVERLQGLKAGFERVATPAWATT